MIHYLHIAILSVLFLLFLPIPSFPQFPEPIFEHLTVADGLPENSVRCILQDHLGYMWFGTQNGLVKYDGYDMKVYQPISGDSLSISDRQIYALYEDDSGTLWIGTPKGGLNRFDRTTETFTSYLHNPNDSTSINSNVVLSICEDKTGNILVGTNEGLNLFERQKESFKHIYYQDSIYQLWYAGWDSTNLRIGYATSADRINWIKYAGNPVLNLGEAGSWDSAGVTSPTVVYHDGTYYMWYTGGEEMIPGIPFLNISFPGYAFSSDGINWTKYAENPISYNPSVVSSGDAYYDGSDYHMWFSFCEWDGECHYRIHYSTAATTGIDEKSYNFPKQFELSQNFPNPFNPVTTIKYQVPELSVVTLKIYDVLGSEIITLVNEEKPIGSYEIEFDATRLPSGIYFYRLQANDFTQVKKMILLK